MKKINTTREISPRLRTVNPSNKMLTRSLHRIFVECRDEADQKALYEQMTSQGRKCRVLTW